LSGFSSADLKAYSTAAQYRQTFPHQPLFHATRAGFDWCLCYLVMPSYAATFFYSPMLARKVPPTCMGRLLRVLTLACSGPPIAGAPLDGQRTLWN
jgi:hypothetical protein